MSDETSREAAYRTITEPMTVRDAAREMRVTAGFVLRQIEDEKLLASPDGRIDGPELSRYFTAHRRD